jgi:hypothetical protein
MTITLEAAPATGREALSVGELAKRAFALVVGFYIHDQPDAKRIVVADDKHDPLPDDIETGIVRCELIHDGVKYKGTVWVNVCGKTTAKLSYAASTTRHRAKFVFSEYKSETVREDYIRWHRGE